MSDELEAKIKAARKLAHEAPKEPEGGSMTWARRAREYFNLLDEQERDKR